MHRREGKSSETCILEYNEPVLNKKKLLISNQHKKLLGNANKQIESLLSTNINTESGYNTQKLSCCNDQTLKIDTNLIHSQYHISQVSSSSKIKHVTPTFVKPKSTIFKILSVNTFITEKLRILYTLWKIPIVIKNYFNKFHEHDRKVEHDNDDFSRNDLGNFLLCHFMTKNELSSEVDVYTIFDLLSFDTLNKAYLAWFDEKDEIEQAKIKKRS